MQDPRGFEQNHFCQHFYDEVAIPHLNNLFNKMDWAQEETLMDYGCGPGNFSYKMVLPILKMHNSSLFSIDASAEVIEYAKQANSDPRIKYFVGDILGKFPFPGVKFDKIFAFHVFHCIKQLRQTLDGFNAVLAPGGYVCFLTFTERYWAFQTNKMLSKSDTWGFAMEGHDNYYPDWSSFPLGEGEQVFRKLLEDSGFTVVYLEAPELVLANTDLESYMDLQIAAHPGLHKISAEMQLKLKEDLRAMMSNIAGVCELGNKVNMPFEYIVGVAKKR